MKGASCPESAGSVLRKDKRHVAVPDPCVEVTLAFENLVPARTIEADRLFLGGQPYLHHLIWPSAIFQGHLASRKHQFTPNSKTTRRGKHRDAANVAVAWRLRKNPRGPKITPITRRQEMNGPRCGIQRVDFLFNGDTLLLHEDFHAYCPATLQPLTGADNFNHRNTPSRRSSRECCRSSG